MTNDHAANKLTQKLQNGTDSGETQGWVSEEAARLLDVDEDEADRKIFDAAMAAHLKNPIVHSLDEVCRLLDLEEPN